MDINWHIEKECPCGYKYLDSLPATHIRSNQHNFALAEQRKEVKKLPLTNGGKCDVCNIHIKYNLPRHLLTNAHIRRYDVYTTYKAIEDRIKSNSAQQPYADQDKIQCEVKRTQ